MTGALFFAPDPITPARNAFSRSGGKQECLPSKADYSINRLLEFELPDLLSDALQSPSGVQEPGQAS
jgi:hypothetical protein